MIEISGYDLMLLVSALEETITALYNRFEEEKGYVHPSKKYEKLHDKIEEIRDSNDFFKTFKITGQ